MEKGFILSREIHRLYLSEPSAGVDRIALAVLCDAYHEERTTNDEQQTTRIVLKLHPKLAPYKAAVFPLLRNKPELVEKARSIYKLLATSYQLPGLIAWDDRGNIGKRYYSQDEIGTPYCITVDFQTLEDSTVTIRDRDTAKQERVAVKDIAEWMASKLEL